MHLSQLDKEEQSFNPCQLAQIPTLGLTGLWWGCLLCDTRHPQQWDALEAPG